MANSIPSFTKIPIPFANNGDKNTIPQNATGTNLASFSEGFPEITSQPIDNGGQPPTRQDFNGIGNALSNNISYLQQGGIFTFDPSISSAIGGYAQGAILSYINNGKLYKLISLVNNNTYNFNDDSSYIGQYWDYADNQSGQSGVSIYIGTVFSYISKRPPEGTYLLNGQTITDCATLYPQFYNWLVENAGLNNIRTVTASQFNQEVTEYGICNGFVIDTNAGSVRLPLWKGYQSPLGNNFPVIGNGDVNASYLHTTTALTGSQDAGINLTTGQLYAGNVSNPLIWNTDNTGLKLDVKSYQYDFTWCIQVYNVATDLSEQQSAQLASEMQMKAQTDLANVTANLDFVVESWNDGQGNWYRKYRSGWVEQGGKVSGVQGTQNQDITVSLLVEMANTEYFASFSFTGATVYRNDFYGGHMGAYQKTINSFVTFISNVAGINEKVWRVEGQGAN
jgi:hypothetical protein